MTVLTVLVQKPFVVIIPRGYKYQHPERAMTKGNGYLEGSYPDGLTTVNGVGVAATIRVHYRAGTGIVGDGMLVKEVQSNASGVWLVTGLDPTKKYDVIGRKGTYNDVIVSDVTPKV